MLMNKEKTHPEYRIDWHDAYAIFTITRPDKLNTITNAILQGLEACLDEIEVRGMRGLVIAGEGRAFSAGTDLAEAASLSFDEGQAKGERARGLFYRLYRSPITSVAAIQGIAFGGGLELALGCTLRVAGPAAQLALPEIKLAVLPAYGGTQFLPALIGKARAADLMLTGRAVNAEEALQMGLVSRLADAGEEQAVAEALVREITGYSQFAIARVRRCLGVAGADVTEEGLAVEAVAFREATTSEDAKEGVTAFLEKRKPNYRHR